MKTLSHAVTGRRSGSLDVAVRTEGIPAALWTVRAALERGDRDPALRQGLDAGVEAAVAELLDRRPPRVDAGLMLALLLGRLGDDERAATWFERVLARVPHPTALQELAVLRRRQGHFDRATDLRLRLLEQRPDHRPALIDVGLDLLCEGRLHWGLDWLRRAVDLAPEDHDAALRLLVHRHYLAGEDPARLSADLRDWGRRAWPSRLAGPAPGGDRDPERRLRVGYLSGDFRRNSAAYNLEALLEHHDRRAVTVIAYSNVTEPDAVTERLRGRVDLWRDITALDDDAAAALIVRDGVDILVPVAGAVDGQRLGILARRPAPLQFDFQGIDTSGLIQVDYRLSDTILDPPGTEDRYAERTIRLPGCLYCYRPPAAAPAVGPLPASAHGHVTFGSCNSRLKIHAGTLALWARILDAVPASRLRIKFRGGHVARSRAHLLTQCAAQGIDVARVTIEAHRRPEQALDIYRGIDLALDTFPFNGCITTLESLWMGVPVVTLAGDSLVGRAGATLLHALDMDACVADSPEAYVTKAVALAGNLPVLARLRAGLRCRLALSGLCDGAAYARRVEQAYRTAWRRVCRGTPRPAPEPVGEDRLEFYVLEESDLKVVVSKRILPPALRAVAAHTEGGRMDEAAAALAAVDIAAVQARARREPATAGAVFVLAMALHRVERCAEAEACYRLVADLDPHPLVFFELASLCRRAGRITEALEHERRALALAPDCAEIQAALADHLIKAGRGAEGLDLLERVVRGQGDIISHSKYLWHLHQRDELDRAAVFAEHRAWAQRYRPAQRARTTHEREPDPERRLRIGYISPDFCSHSVAYFFAPLLEAHDAGTVETFGYGNVPHPDPVTERLRAGFAHYRNVLGQSAEAVAAQVEADRIDILVDLAGHTGDNRLDVLALKPAPIQVSYLGYPDTTGMTQVDYRFTDRWADGPDAAAYHSEALVRLDTGFNCYEPPAFAPPVGPLPALSQGHVTFGSFNNNCKINTHILDLWARILRGVPSARLLLKFSGGDDPGLQTYYRDALRACGIDPARLSLVGRLDVRAHLDLYNRVDLALDTYPYHGTTTTCEALWMGVPTVTRVGSHHAARVGLSLLARLDLEVFAADSDAAYVDKARSFAAQPEALAQIRGALRGWMRRSALCDKTAYARCVEAAYRDMWRRWCHTRGGRP